RLPQKEKPDTSIPTEAEVSALLKATEGEPIHTAILLGAVGTLRRSEICALLKSDVTDKGVMVNKAMVMDENKEWVIKGTKTTAGTRFVELPKYVIDELRAIEGDRIYKDQPGRSDETFLYFEKEGF
ncbi:MAG: site-specific integrase, partial [Ruminococcus bromii]|nr:site-specific integrase [Ruminococcus bromii]